MSGRTRAGKKRKYDQSEFESQPETNGRSKSVSIKVTKDKSTNAGKKKGKAVTAEATFHEGQDFVSMSIDTDAEDMFIEDEDR